MNTSDAKPFERQTTAARFDKAIYLIRHGESVSTVKGIYQGSDDPLTDRGRAQARALGSRLKKHYPIERIIASTHMRAHETASIIGTAVGLTPLCTPLLIERRQPNTIIGRRTDDTIAIAIHKEGQERFHDPNFVYGDGETFDDMKARALAALMYILDQPGKHIAVVTHGVFATLLAAASQRGDTLTSHDLNAYQLRLANTGLCIFAHRKRRTFSGIDHGWIILRWNDIAHLEGKPTLNGKYTLSQD
jgi:broad specificity phosphatase PhoE